MINMEHIMNYIKPELVVVAMVLYFVGMGLKQAQAVKDKYIPAILGAVGILLATLYVIVKQSRGRVIVLFLIAPAQKKGDRHGRIKT